MAMCYVFTVRARLTPKWNSVDNFLVQGVLRPVPRVPVFTHAGGGAVLPTLDTEYCVKIACPVY